MIRMIRPTRDPRPRSPLHAHPRSSPGAPAALALCALLTVACRGPQAAGPTAIEIDAREYSRLFEAATLVLRDTGFDVARQDYRFGELASTPLKSPLFFEFWEPTHGHGLTVQDSTNDQRRVARVYLEPAASAAADADEPANYVMGVEIVIERLQQPLRYLTNSPRQPIGTLADVPAEVARLGVYGPYWQPVGRDDALAARILAQAVRRSLTLPREQTPPPPLPAAADRAL